MHMNDLLMHYMHCAFAWYPHRTEEGAGAKVMPFARAACGLPYPLSHLSSLMFWFVNFCLLTYLS